jgi:hypothetical protein
MLTFPARFVCTDMTRKLVLHMMTTQDGCIADREDRLSWEWTNWDEEMRGFYNPLFASAGGLMLRPSGRTRRWDQVVRCAPAHRSSWSWPTSPPSVRAASPSAIGWSEPRRRDTVSGLTQMAWIKIFRASMILVTQCDVPIETHLLPWEMSCSKYACSDRSRSLAGGAGAVS